MVETISIKVTTIKPEPRSRGRVATSTRTLIRGIRADAHPAEIMHATSLCFPLLKHLPASYQVRGVRYELLRIERRTVSGVRVARAVFKGERDVRKSFAREMRRRHRAARKAAIREARLEARVRNARVRELLARAIACALIARACAAQRRAAAEALTARVPMLTLSSLYLSAPRQNYLKYLHSS